MSVKTVYDLKVLLNAWVATSEGEARRLAFRLEKDPLAAVDSVDLVRLPFAKGTVARQVLADAEAFVERVGEADFLDGLFAQAVHGVTHPGTTPTQLAVRAAWGALLSAFSATRSVD